MSKPVPVSPPPFQVFRDPPDGPEMVVIPGGRFLMGSPTDEAERLDREGPQHDVTVPSFALARHAVTVGEYRAFVSATGHTPNHEDEEINWQSPGFAQDDRHPVTYVSWWDAKAYAAWLAQRTGRLYRLPTEAEWEYACRAGTTTPFSFGETISPEQANYRGNYTYGGGRKGKWRVRTVPVGSLPANPWGLHEMHGNVCEWVEDAYRDSYVGAPADGSQAVPGDEAALRVVRGGSWDDFPKFLRSAYRSRYSPVYRVYDVGFRLARTLGNTGGTETSIGFSDFQGGIGVVPGGATGGQGGTLPQPRTAAPPPPLQVFCDPPDGPEMVVIPAGRFVMGAPKHEAERLRDDGPQRDVVIRSPLAVGKYAVTFAEWDACVAAGGCDRYRPKDRGWGRGNRPVINVSWHDAQAYARWLSARTGKGYRLLTEAEWEYACRAGTTTPFSFGETITPEQANYDGNNTYGNGPKGVYRRRTVPVGSLPANPWGLHEMHGNVFEWVEDAYRDNYDGAPKDGSQAVPGDEAALRVLRGGSWFFNPRFLRSAFRDWNSSVIRYLNVGFRLARTL